MSDRGHKTHTMLSLTHFQDSVKLIEGFINPLARPPSLDAFPVGEPSWSRFSGSAGACPPRSPSSRCRLRSFRTEENKRRFFLGANDGEGQALALREGRRFFILVRGPVPRVLWIARTIARDRPSPYDAGGLSATAGPGGAPPYCIETRRSLLPGKRQSKPKMKCLFFLPTHSVSTCPRAWHTSRRYGRRKSQPESALSR